MATTPYRLERLTRREFREARARGWFKLGIVPVGSIEQHLEHLTFDMDIASSTYVASRIAEAVYPGAIVAAPVAVGISEHHMYFPGTLTAKPGGWLAVVFDAIEDMVRHGATKVLVVNGHGGNVALLNGAHDQWRFHLARVFGAPLTDDEVAGVISHNQYTERLLKPGRQVVDLRIANYWELMPEGFMQEVLQTNIGGGHAQEFETSFGMYALPDNVRPEAIPHSQDEGASLATVEKGRVLAEKIVETGVALAREMLAG